MGSSVGEVEKLHKKQSTHRLGREKHSMGRG